MFVVIDISIVVSIVCAFIVLASCIRCVWLQYPLYMHSASVVCAFSVRCRADVEPIPYPSIPYNILCILSRDFDLLSYIYNEKRALSLLHLIF